MEAEVITKIEDLAAAAADKSAFVVESEGVRLLARRMENGGVEVKSMKPFIDEFATAPDRRKGSATANTMDTFIDLVNRHKDGDSVVFCKLSGDHPFFNAVMDYHKQDGAPRFGKHRVNYGYPPSMIWLAWKTRDGSNQSQAEFATFIENHVEDMASPYEAEVAQYENLFRCKFATASDMLTLSRGLIINVENALGEVRNLRTGETQITFNETHKGSDGAALIVPGLFVINVPLFEGAPPTRLIARLRYKRDSGLKWSWHLYRADDIIRASLLGDRDRVAKETSLPVYEGAPES